MMSRVLKTLLAVGLSVATLAGAVAPVSAMPLVPVPAAGNTIELAQWGPPPGPGYGPPPGYRRPPGPPPGYNRPPGYYRPPGPPPGYHRPPPPRPGWHNGYQGYRHQRPGYRYHNGYWFPLAAFAAGAIIGGAIAQPPAPSRPAPGAGINPKHFDWCSARYRSYRSYDNTFQPNYGPRQQCLSPYY